MTHPDDKEDVKREIEILHHLNGHPNICEFKGAYEDRHNIHIVLELCTGGELFDRFALMLYFCCERSSELFNEDTIRRKMRRNVYERC